MADKAVEESYEEYRKDKESPTKKIHSSFSRKQIIITAVVIAIAGYLIFIAKVFHDKERWYLIGAIAIVLYLLFKQGDVEASIITMREAMAIVKKEVDHMQHNTYQIPQGNTRVAPIAKLKHMEGKPTKWRVGVEVETHRFKHKQYIAEVEPYEGYVMGIYEVPRGFGEIDKPDVKFILPKELQWRKRYDLDDASYRRQEHYEQPPR